MKPRTLLVLFALVVVLGAFIGLYERKLPSTEERLKLGDRILELGKDAVTAVDIERDGQGAVHLERVTPAVQPPPPAKPDGALGEPPPPPAEWRVSQPAATATGGAASQVARADTNLVSGLVEALVGLARTRTLDNPDAKSVGLDHPQATVRVKTAQGERVLRFGAKVPTGGEVLVGLEGGGHDHDVYVTSDAILSNLARTPGDWRDHQMFFADRDAIDRIRLSGPEGDTVLARKGTDFEIVQPVAVKDRADHDLVESLLSDLTGLRAQTFVDDPKVTPASLGLDPARSVVEVTLKSGDTVRVELGAAAPAAPPAPGAAPEAGGAGGGVYVRTIGPTGATFSAQTTLAAATARAPGDWRSHALSAFQVFEVESVQVTDAGGSFAVARSEPGGTDWKRGKDTISYTPVSDLLFAVVGGKASGLLPAGTPAPGTPVLTLHLTREKTEKAVSAGEETLTFYPPTAQGAPVQVSGRTPLLLLPSDRLAEIQKQVAAIRSAQPVAPASAGEQSKKK